MVMSSNVLICPINSQKPKEIEFIVLYNTTKLQILTLEKLEPVIIWFISYIIHMFYFKSDSNDYLIIKLVRFID